MSRTPQNVHATCINQKEAQISELVKMIVIFPGSGLEHGDYSYADITL